MFDLQTFWKYTTTRASRPFTNLKNVCGQIGIHESTETHKHSVSDYLQWKKGLSIVEVMENASRSLREKRRKYMCTLVRSFLFLLDEEIPTTTKFAKLIELQRANGNDFLKEIQDKLSLKMKYDSQRFIQELHDSTWKVMQRRLAECISKAEFMSVSADECLDISGKEQLAIVARFLDDGKIEEALLGIVEIKRLDGETIGNAICDFLRKFFQNSDLKPPLIVNQTYDGASAMKYVVSKVVQGSLSPHALNVHCSSHVVNLVVKDALKAVNICRDVTEFAHEIYWYFFPPNYGASKRKESLHTAFSLLGRKVKYPIKESDTRWDSRFESTLRLSDIYEPLVIGLINLAEQCDDPVARGYATKMLNANFLVCAFILPQILECIVAMNKKLQARDFQVSSFPQLLESCVNDINSTLKFPYLEKLEACILSLHKSKYHLTLGSSKYSEEMDNEDQEYMGLFDGVMQSIFKMCPLEEKMSLFLDKLTYLLKAQTIRNISLNELIERYVDIRKYNFFSNKDPISRRRNPKLGSKSSFPESLVETRSNCVKDILAKKLKTSFERMQSSLNEGKLLGSTMYVEDECPEIVRFWDFITHLPLKAVIMNWCKQNAHEISSTFKDVFQKRFCNSERDLLNSSLALCPHLMPDNKDPKKCLSILSPLVNFYSEKRICEYTGKSGRTYYCEEDAVLCEPDIRKQYPFYHSCLMDLYAEQQEVCPGARLSLDDIGFHLKEESYRFPEVFRLVNIIETWFAGTATAERTFSGMARVKTRFRGSLGNNNLNCHLLWRINNFKINDGIVKEIVDLWYKGKARNIMM